MPPLVDLLHDRIPFGTVGKPAVRPQNGFAPFPAALNDPHLDLDHLALGRTEVLKMHMFRNEPAQRMESFGIDVCATARRTFGASANCATGCGTIAAGSP